MFHDRAAATGNARSPRLDRRRCRHEQSRRRRRHASVSDVRQVQCLGEVLWGSTVKKKTAVGKDTQTELNTLRDLQPMKFPE